MYTAKKIKDEMEKNNIIITPFDESRLNANSYNLTLSPELMVYCNNTNKPIDMKKKNPTVKFTIPEEGYILEPGRLYLARTNEYTMTKNAIPCLSGRSSIGRLGINVHVTAGFGDIGFSGYWTLEIFVVEPVKIYPNCEICQIYYEEADGDIDKTYDGKYQNNNGIQESYMFKEYNK